MASATEISRNLSSDIKKQADEHAAKERSSFHKGYKVKEYGLSNPVLHATQKKYKKDILALPCGEAFTLTNKLLEKQSEEEVSSAVYVLSLRLDCFSKSNVAKILNKTSQSLVSWSTTDGFCSSVTQPLLPQFKKELPPVLRRWNASGDIWQQRASVVTFTRKIGETGAFTREALGLCDNLIWSKQELIQKAVGWCLKDIMREIKRKSSSMLKS